MITPLSLSCLARPSRTLHSSSATRHSLQQFPQTLTLTARQQQKRLHRKGQNLTERYSRLERSLRRKEIISKHSSDLLRSPVVQIPPVSSLHVKTNPNPTRFFKGFRIPEEPEPPKPDECCMSGCAICVHDLYQDALIAYKESLESLGNDLMKLQIPESEWPISVRAAMRANQPQRNVTLNAFEELEAALREKRTKASEAREGTRRQYQN